VKKLNVTKNPEGKKAFYKNGMVKEKEKWFWFRF